MESGHINVRSHAIAEKSDLNCELLPSVAKPASGKTQHSISFVLSKATFITLQLLHLWWIQMKN